MATGIVTCPVGVYTQIGNGSATVAFRVKTSIATTQIRLANAGSAPAASTANYVTVSNRDWLRLTGITHNLYIMPMNKEAVVEVIDGS